MRVSYRSVRASNEKWQNVGFARMPSALSKKKCVNLDSLKEIKQELIKNITALRDSIVQLYTSLSPYCNPLIRATLHDDICCIIDNLNKGKEYLESENHRENLNQHLSKIHLIQESAKGIEVDVKGFFQPLMLRESAHILADAYFLNGCLHNPQATEPYFQALYTVLCLLQNRSF